MKFVRTFTAAMIAVSLAACGGGSFDDEADASQNQGFVVVDDANAPAPSASQGFVVVDDARAPNAGAGKTRPRGASVNFVVVDD